MPAMVRAQTSAETSTPGIVVYGRTRCPVAAERWIASSSRWRLTACAKSGADGGALRSGRRESRRTRARARGGGCAGQVRKGVVPVREVNAQLSAPPRAHGDGREVRMARGGHFERRLGAVEDQREPGPCRRAGWAERTAPPRTVPDTAIWSSAVIATVCPESARATCRPPRGGRRHHARRARRRPSSPRRSRVRTRSSAASPRSGGRACTACARTPGAPSLRGRRRRSRTAPRRRSVGHEVGQPAKGR